MQKITNKKSTLSLVAVSCRYASQLKRDFPVLTNIKLA